MKLAYLLSCGLLAVGAMSCALPAQAVDAGGGGGRGIISLPRPMPVPPEGWVYRYAGPVYQTVVERVWIADRVEMVSQWMEISPGRLEQVWRQVVIPGHWETTTRRVLVADAHWELVRLDPPVPVPYYPPPVVVIIPPAGTVGVDGYGTFQTEDLSKFSPLKEWPDKK